MATLTASLFLNGQSGPMGTTTEGPVQDIYTTNLTSFEGVITCTTAGQQIPVPASGAGLGVLLAPANAGVTLAIYLGNAGGTTPGVNIGSGWTWQKFGYTPGTSTLYISQAAGGATVITYQLA